MAKRKSATRKKSLLQASQRLKESIATLLRQGELKKAFSQLDILKMRLANSPELLEQTMTEIALAITDDDTDIEKRKTAFGELQGIDPSSKSRALVAYGLVLGKFGQYEAAIEKYEQALQINPNNTDALRNYGVTLFVQAMTLEKEGRYEDAISKYEEALLILKKISSDALSQLFAKYTYLNLGRLYYLNKFEKKGKKYFDLAIQNSTDKDAERIEVAQRIFALNPYSEEGVAILQEITETSPHYALAFKSLSLNLSPKAYYQMFNTNTENTLRDTEVLNRAIYHKIANEISILKEIVHEIVVDYPGQDKMLSDVLASIDHILAGIRQRREVEKAKVKTIPVDDYDRVIEVVSATAHDISDFVNNELAVIEEDIRFALDKGATPASPNQALEDLLAQIKITQEALNDLKAINEGIKIKRSRFKVKELFEKWAKNPKLQNATISLEIENGESPFDGDEQKIKGFINELVENSLKHNPDREDLAIRIASKDVVSEGGQPRTLRIIYSDDGQGIPADKKQWIFLPLKTTSAVGSGLGLFIIKRTLQEMGGYIEETGENGVRFEVSIPYPDTSERQDIEDQVPEQTIGQPEEDIERSPIVG